MIHGAHFKEGLTQVQLAEASGIPRWHISEIENNRRIIGKDGHAVGRGSQGGLSGVSVGR